MNRKIIKIDPEILKRKVSALGGSPYNIFAHSVDKKSAYLCQIDRQYQDLVAYLLRWQTAQKIPLCMQKGYAVNKTYFAQQIKVLDEPTRQLIFAKILGIDPGSADLVLDDQLSFEEFQTRTERSVIMTARAEKKIKAQVIALDKARQKVLACLKNEQADPLGDDHQAVAAKKVLEIVKNATTDIISTLSQLCHDPDKHLREMAAVAIRSIGPMAKAAVPDLRDLCKENGPKLRRAAAYALGEIGPEAGSAVPELRALLADTIWDVRIAAIEALDRIGPKAKAALPELLKLANDPDKHISQIAQEAISSIER
ncbi:MAG: HEAT repeat domain-containing protein [Candidatus Margulisiibacteriota bacterium]|jgi:hypothetical protein